MAATEALRRRGLRLASYIIAWDLVEGAIAVSAGLAAGCSPTTSRPASSPASAPTRSSAGGGPTPSSRSRSPPSPPSRHATPGSRRANANRADSARLRRPVVAANSMGVLIPGESGVGVANSICSAYFASIADGISRRLSPDRFMHHVTRDSKADVAARSRAARGRRRTGRRAPRPRARRRTGARGLPPCTRARAATPGAGC